MIEIINRYYLTGEFRMAQAGEFYRGSEDDGAVWLGPSKEPARILEKRIEKIISENKKEVLTK